jgi:hypothetical protein
MRLAPSTVQGRWPGLEGATGWLNSPPLTPADLRGKVGLRRLRGEPRD